MNCFTCGQGLTQSRMFTSFSVMTERKRSQIQAFSEGCLAQPLAHLRRGQSKAATPPHKKKVDEIVQLSDWDASWMRCTVLLGGGHGVDPGHAAEIWKVALEREAWVSLLWLTGQQKTDGWINRRLTGLKLFLCHGSVARLWQIWGLFWSFKQKLSQRNLTYLLQTV